MSRSPAGQWVQPLLLTQNEESWYRAFFQSAGPDALETVNGQNGYTFLRQSGLPQAALKEIWDIADHHHVGYLNYDQFCVACRLVGRAQTGITDLSKVAHLPLSAPPNFSATPPPSYSPVQGMSPAMPGARPPWPQSQQFGSNPNLRTAYGSNPNLAGGVQQAMPPQFGSNPNLASMSMGMMQMQSPPGAPAAAQFQQQQQQPTFPPHEAQTSLGNLAAAQAQAQQQQSGGQPGTPRQNAPGSSAAARGRSISPLGSKAFTRREMKKYALVFLKLDRNSDGYVDGEDARALMLRSAMENDVLARIWELADSDNDGRLSWPEFLVAMHLVSRARKNEVVPEVLPPHVNRILTNPIDRPEVLAAEATNESSSRSPIRANLPAAGSRTPPTGGVFQARVSSPQFGRNESPDPEGRGGVVNRKREAFKILPMGSGGTDSTNSPDVIPVLAAAKSSSQEKSGNNSNAAAGSGASAEPQVLPAAAANTTIAKSEDDLANEERVKRARERLFASTDVLFSKYQVDLADADDLGEFWRPQSETMPEVSSGNVVPTPPEIPRLGDEVLEADWFLSSEKHQAALMGREAELMEQLCSSIVKQCEAIEAECAKEEEEVGNLETQKSVLQSQYDGLLKEVARLENEAAKFDVEGESVALDHERYLEEIARLEKENKLLESDLQTRQKWQEADEIEHQEVTASTDILERVRRDLASAVQQEEELLKKDERRNAEMRQLLERLSREAGQAEEMKRREMAKVDHLVQMQRKPPSSAPVRRQFQDGRTAMVEQDVPLHGHSWASRMSK